jgi:hypothetical protein
MRTDGRCYISPRTPQDQEHGTPKPRIQRPSPPVVNTTLYRYSPVNLADSEIRLIELDSGTSRTDQVICKLFAVPLAQAPEYEALSYTWGNASDLVQISINSLQVAVTRNLQMALLQLRDATKPRTLWVDAICINQENEDEVGEQVSKMGSIYTSAAQVLVWLGAMGDDSHLAFSILGELHKKIYNPPAFREIIRSPGILYYLEALAKLFNRDYWSRVWVIQEVNFARKIRVHCGHSEMDWNDMIAVQDSLLVDFRTLLPELSTPTNSDLDIILKAIAFRGPLSLLLDRRASKSSTSYNLDLFQVLMMHRLKEATDPRDKVYALVGLTSSRDDPEFVIDYKITAREVFINTVDYMLQQYHHLDIICGKTRGTNLLNLPSWVPDLSCDGSHRPIPFEHAWRSPYHASSTMTATAKIYRTNGILTANGVCLGSVTSISKVSGMDHMGDYVQAVVAIYTWHILVKTHFGKYTTYIDWFVRLLLCDIVTKDELEGRSESEFFQSVLSSLHPTLWPDVIVDPLFDSIPEPSKGTNRGSLGWHQRIAEIIFKRRLFISGNGGLGLAQESILEDDLICILFGCSVPVILREVDGHYIYISDACIVGYMYGRGIKEFEQGKLESRKFEIH